ncbi:hypothetical protein WBG78_30700 [Chryseolinea sp. T2]|uniref:hypothetical protein n=1 Tax=Chryseolinea sp. T2 TaxID=3129255 RepID=UPI003077DCEB
MDIETLNKELNDIFSTEEFEEDGGVYITGTDWYSDDLRVEFVIKPGDNSDNQLWEVQIVGVREELIKSTFGDKLELLDEHPLLWAFSQVQTDLYFTNPTTRPFELFSAIYEIHRRESKNWLPLDKFINKEISPIELCKSKSGLFAKGPLKLLEKYQEVLEQHGMTPSLFGKRNPKRWTNDQWVEETEILRVMILGDSYVIGESFDFKRV